MRRLRNFFKTLRGKLILTYTLVTVLALLALEILCLLVIVTFVSFTNSDRVAYFSDVVYTLYPRASRYMQPGAQDIKGLQEWLNQVYASRHASSDPVSWVDSPAALVVENQPLYILSPDRVVLAQTAQGTNLVGQTFTPPNANAEAVLSNALQGDLSPLRLVTVMYDGNYWMSVPVLQSDAGSPVVGVVVLSVTPPPPLLLQMLPLLAGAVGFTGILLLIAVAPFGALFGMIMSRGLTRRLANLSTAADAWSEGNFSVVPQDRSGDEISALGTRLRHMAERLQTLLRTQQELAMLEERNRIARELHDTIKQQNFASLMQIRAARNQLSTDPSAAAQALTEAEHLIKTSQQELGIMITELHPAALEAQGLVPALRTYVETWSHQSNIVAVFRADHEKRLSPAVEQSLYRVAQEALANVARHSQATTVNVDLRFTESELTLTIADNGIGFDADTARGFGLASMQERLTALDAILEVKSSSGSGTTLVARVPLRKTDERENTPVEAG